ncbi:hypothetical protein CRUP_024109, partial [Coryphaenoides rupestris]
ECQKRLEHKLGLDSYLLKPVQRITKYQLILKEMLKYSRGCDGCQALQEALSSILGILKAVNDSMHLIAITGYEGNLSELGQLLMQGSFSVWTEHKKGHAKVKDLARFKPMQRHLFLHQKALLFCKRREESGEGYEKAPSYSFKHSLNAAVSGGPTVERSSSSSSSSAGRKRFTLQGFGKSPKGPAPLATAAAAAAPGPAAASAVTSPDQQVAPPRHSSPKSEAAPFGFREPGDGPHVPLGRVRWLSSSSLLQSKRR